MRFGSLFSGVGGFDLGFERAGMTCLWQVEIDAKCWDVLAYHWPNVTRYGDVKDVGRHNLGPVDLICGGFPCQDLSVAGQRAGLAGERSGLWFEFYRILDELRPGWVVIENVPGLLSSNGGRDFATILQGLVKLRYGVCWRVLDAQFFGVAQRRRRVFIVGHLGDGRAAQVLFEREGGAWDSAPSREAGQGTAGDVAPCLAASGRGTERTGESRGQDPLVYHENIGGDLTPDDHARALRYGASHSYQFVAYGVSENQRAELRLTPYSRQITSGGGKPGQGYPCVAYGGMYVNETDTALTVGTTDLTAIAIRNSGRDADMRPGRNGTTTQEDVMFSLQAEQQHAIAFDWQSGGDVRHNVSEHHTSALQASQVPAVSSSWGVRRLTPIECERLQGFPDGWTAGQSDSARYRQLGNAVCVPVVEWLGRAARVDE